ncbi:hypothetical protein ACOMHN_059882 [Nucella lapillus]
MVNNRGKSGQVVLKPWQLKSVNPSPEYPQLDKAVPRVPPLALHMYIPSRQLFHVPIHAGTHSKAGISHPQDCELTLMRSSLTSELSEGSWLVRGFQIATVRSLCP